MKWAERAVWSVALAGILFRLLHWPMAGLLLVLGLSTAAILYFPLGWLLLGRPTRRDQLIPLSVLTGLVLSALCIGILFRLQLWPLAIAQLYLRIGLLGAVAVLVAILTLHSRNPGIEHYFKGLRHRLLLIGMPALLLHFTPPGRIIPALYPDDPAKAELLIRLQENPGDTAAQHALRESDQR